MGRVRKPVKSVTCIRTGVLPKFEVVDIDVVADIQDATGYGGETHFGSVNNVTCYIAGSACENTIA